MKKGARLVFSKRRRSVAKRDAKSPNGKEEKDGQAKYYIFHRVLTK